MGEFNATENRYIAKGTCVILDGDGNIVYAGPLKNSPDVSGRDVLLNPEDFKKLETIVKKHRH